MLQKSSDAFAQDCSVSVGFVWTVGGIAFILKQAVAYQPPSFRKESLVCRV